MLDDEPFAALCHDLLHAFSYILGSLAFELGDQLDATFDGCDASLQVPFAKLEGSVR